MTVEIQIGDVNDHSPVFTDKFYSFTIRENAEIGVMVGQMNAKDADQVSDTTYFYYVIIITR